MITFTISMQWYWWLLLAVYVAWFGFLAYASLKRSWKVLKVGMKVLSVSGMFVFGLLDVVLLQCIIGTILFFELPREMTFSQRCSRHNRANTSGWRGWWARAFAVPLSAVEEGHGR